MIFSLSLLNEPGTVLLEVLYSSLYKTDSIGNTSL
jgi:hypothetical protein